MDWVIRAGRTEDADPIGAVHVRAWQAAYRGIMPDGYLDGLRAEDRAAMWCRFLAEPHPRQQLLVAVLDGEVVGFAVFGPEAGGSDEGADEDDVGELYAINLDRRQWGTGLGRALLDDVTRWLLGFGFRSAVLWVAPENHRARAFYESTGWAADGTSREAEVLGVTVAEVRYRRQL